MGCAELEFLARLIEHVDDAGVGRRQLHRLCHDGGQHGLQIERRVDCLAYFAERLELLDRASELAGAGLHLVEQTHVLDGDHGLVGKGGHQLHLRFVERPHGTAHEANDADRSPRAQEGHTKQSAKAA